MRTLGWLFILFAAVMARQVSKGRVPYLTVDLSDMMLAIISTDTAKMTEVLARKGDGSTAVIAPRDVDLGDIDVVDENLPGNAGLAQTVVELGSNAKGYRWTATGPDYYDCSGLVYAAMKKLGYKGSRFTTATLKMQKNMFTTRNPQVGDMVLWLPGEGGVTGHMGVITGANEFYSARSKRSGIGYDKISTFRKVQPTYIRWMKNG